MSGPVTLTIDIGGTGIKTLRLDAAAQPLGERRRVLTPDSGLPEPIVEMIAELVRDEEAFDRVSVGFPGVVIRGVTKNAPNLDSAAWCDIPLGERIASLAGKPTRVANDADLQGYGVITGRGVELVATLGTGLGSALFVDGRLVPNLELGHHPFGDGATYEQRVSDDACHAIGPDEFHRRVKASVGQLRALFNFELLHLGGGNVRFVDVEDLGPDVRAFTNEEGMRGGARLWSL